MLPKECDYYPGIQRAGNPSPVCLAPCGVYPASAVALGAVSSYLPVSPLPVPYGHRRFIFCGTFRPEALGKLPSPAFTGRTALRCPDFPPEEQAFPATTRTRLVALVYRFPANIANQINKESEDGSS